MFGAIEAGGTKFICGIGSGPQDLEIAQFPTSSPEVTLRSVIEYFKASRQPLQGIGIGSFGPIDLRLDSSDYGRITSTPKTAWVNFDLVGAVSRALDVPVSFDTDVNAALLGEAKWGAARGLSDAIYITIGTGIGGGALANGQLIHGLVHTEMGHLRLPHDLVRDPYPGGCPYHGDCFEGLASGPAIQARWGALAMTLPPEHPAWALEAQYIGYALNNLVVSLSPQRILLGGGVMQQPQIFPLIRQQFAYVLNGYIQHPQLEPAALDKFIQPPQLGGRAGILGSLALGQNASQAQHPASTLTGGRA